MKIFDRIENSLNTLTMAMGVYWFWLPVQPPQYNNPPPSSNTLLLEGDYNHSIKDEAVANKMGKNRTKKSPSKLENVVFIKTHSSAIKKSCQELGMPPSVKMAQMILESGWGKSRLSREANNYFGIKHKVDFTDVELTKVKGYYEIVTKEERKHKIVHEVAKFAKYHKVGDCIAHHSIFLQGRIMSGRYSECKRLVDNGDKDYKKWARALQEDGYCTSTTYSKKLIKIIEDFDLTKLDV